MEPFEREALKYSSQMAGEFIEYLGKTDMATYTEVEWMQLLECIAVNFCTKRAALSDAVPF